MQERYGQFAQPNTISTTLVDATTAAQQVNVTHYFTLLTANAVRDNIRGTQEETERYTEESLKTLKIDG